MATVAELQQTVAALTERVEGLEQQLTALAVETKSVFERAGFIHVAEPEPQDDDAQA